MNVLNELYTWCPASCRLACTYAQPLCCVGLCCVCVCVCLRSETKSLLDTQTLSDANSLYKCNLTANYFNVNYTKQKTRLSEVVLSHSQDCQAERTDLI